MPTPFLNLPQVIIGGLLELLQFKVPLPLLPPMVKSPEIVIFPVVELLMVNVPSVVEPMVIFATLIDAGVALIVTVNPPSIITLSELPGPPLVRAVPPELNDQVLEADQRPSLTE